jgi:hypothetical protein
MQKFPDSWEFDDEEWVVSVSFINDENLKAINKIQFLTNKGNRSPDFGGL